MFALKNLSCSTRQVQYTTLLFVVTLFILIWKALFIYDFLSSLSSHFAGCYACVIKLEISYAFSTKVDTEEEEEEEDKEDSPAPTDSVSEI